ncbi:hypothetical protein [Bacillus gaemokensis]|uniref:Phr family secreted Rap phosphatase inhibitor n=1 Tax=Bacillus gaemokensis TaxID=574375 RepID=A0A073KEU5_9BACI|nr:hypothetical protein [Bacillus gaemokensis]KEK24937.1 hypothetical protein BAGA_21930 [Bacillus gaemokensis]KYG30246.1 hypothetical protein AZF08_12930 [Bacillus gaemokensis]
MKKVRVTVMGITLASILLLGFNNSLTNQSLNIGETGAPQRPNLTYNIGDTPAPAEARGDTGGIVSNESHADHF